MKKARISSLRSIGKNAGKLSAMTLIIALGFAFIFGISITPSKVRDTFSSSLKKNKFSDFQIKSTNADGFSDEELAALKGIEGANVETVFCLDSSSFKSSMSLYELIDNYACTALIDNGLTKSQAERIINMLKIAIDGDVKDFVKFTPDLMGEGNNRIFAFHEGKSDFVNVWNAVEFAEGKDLYSLEDGDILADALYCQSAVGDKVSIFGKEYAIAGKISNPLYFSRTGEPDVINQKALDNIFYLPSSLSDAPSLNSLVQESLLAYLETKASLADTVKTYIKGALENIKITFPSATDAFLVFDSRSAYNLFSDEYLSYSETKKAEIAEILQSATPSSPKAQFEILTAKENYSYALLKESCAKMDSICYVIPVFFLAVSALVVSITMSRLIEEERPRIACLSSLGYSGLYIAKKYLFLAFASTLLGILLGVTGGYFGVYPLIYNAFEYPYRLPPSPVSSINPTLTLISAAAMLLFILLITISQLKSTLHPLPAALLQAKTPGSGQTTSFERTSLWDKAPFRFKSTFRNLVRYKKRLWMTAISVGGSTAIVFLGFALLNIVSALSSGEGGAVASSITPISYFLIAFAVVLSALVLYSLTDMSIAERSREIATLEVLGYHQGETVFYLYREIAIMAIIGLIIGVPLGIGIIEIVILYLNFGSISDIKWYSYLVPVLVIGFFSFLVDLLLLPKIKRIDMISSLKSVD